MVCFMLLANESERHMNQLAANDQVLGMCIFLTLYILVCRENSFGAALVLSWGISIKAGGILLIPAFLATVHY